MSCASCQVSQKPCCNGKSPSLISLYNNPAYWPSVGGIVGAPINRPATRDTVFAVIAPFLNNFEGKLNFMYLDSKGFVTTGIGNLINSIADAQRLPWVHQSNGQRATPQEIATAWTTVHNRTDLAPLGGSKFRGVTDLILPDAALASLVQGQVLANDVALAQSYPDFANWPADAQLGAHSMGWALGTNFRARNFVNFDAALRARDFARAAAESHILNLDSRFGNPLSRNEADALLFRNANAVQTQRLDPQPVHVDARSFPIPVGGAGSEIINRTGVSSNSPLTTIALAGVLGLSGWWLYSQYGSKLGKKVRRAF